MDDLSPVTFETIVPNICQETTNFKSWLTVWSFNNGEDSFRSQIECLTAQ